MSDRITQTRCAGILIQVASPPSRQGIGSMGRESRRFVDLLAEMGVRIWQILPLNPLGFGNSPYQPFFPMHYKEPYLRDAFEHFKGQGEDTGYAAGLFQPDWAEMGQSHL